MVLVGQHDQVWDGSENDDYDDKGAVKMLS